MDLTPLAAALDALPRRRIGFYPTPFHRLANLSAARGVDLYLKREDLAGPGAISGSKTRLAEFILGRAAEHGVTHVITQGVHLTNSGLQFAAACRVAGITPILYLTRDASRHGEIAEYRGNLLLNKAMGVETHFFTTDGGAYWDAAEDLARVEDAMRAREAELRREGHRPIVVPTGGAHPDGFAAHASTFLEILEQAGSTGIDYVYHTIGTGTALPGMLAAKLITGSPARFRSIAICAYDEGGWMSPSVIVERTQEVMKALGAEVPDAAAIRAEIDVDQRFIGEDYAVPTPESSAAIRELARHEGVFAGPVYTGKGLAGLFDHIGSGRVEPGSSVVFLHTGDAGNLFEVAGVVGDLTSAG